MTNKKPEKQKQLSRQAELAPEELIKNSGFRCQLCGLPITKEGELSHANIFFCYSRNAGKTVHHVPVAIHTTRCYGPIQFGIDRQNGTMRGSVDFDKFYKELIQLVLDNDSRKNHRRNRQGNLKAKRKRTGKAAFNK